MKRIIESKRKNKIYYVDKIAKGKIPKNYKENIIETFDSRGIVFSVANIGGEGFGISEKPRKEFFHSNDPDFLINAMTRIL